MSFWITQFVCIFIPIGRVFLPTPAPDVCVTERTQARYCSHGEQLQAKKPSEQPAPILTLLGHRRSITMICYSSDGKYLATGSTDRTARVWDASTGKLLQTFRGHRGRVTSLCFSPDGNNIVTGSSDGTVRIWQVRSLSIPKIALHYCTQCGEPLTSAYFYCTHCGERQ